MRDVKPPPINRGTQSVKEFRQHRKAMRKLEGKFIPYNADRAAKQAEQLRIDWEYLVIYGSGWTEVPAVKDLEVEVT